MGLIQLVYTSFPDKLTEKEINSILYQSRINNAEKGITGILLRIENLFLQILEGEEEIVCSLFQKIKNDRRHRHCILFSKTSVQARQFNKWSLDYKAINYNICSDIVHQPVKDENVLLNFLIDHAGNPAVRLVQNFYNRKGASYA